MKRAIVIALVLGLALILLSACSKEDIEEVKDFVEEKDLGEKAGCTTLCYKLAVKTGQEIDNCADAGLGAKCVEYFRANPVSIKEFQGELSIFEQGGGGIAETGIAIDCSDTLLTLEDIKPLGPGQYTSPENVISFNSLSGTGFVNYCEIDIRAQEIPPGDTSGNYSDDVVKPDLMFTSSAGLTTLSKYPSEYYGTGNIERDIKIIYEQKLKEKSADVQKTRGLIRGPIAPSQEGLEGLERFKTVKRKVIPVSLGDAATFFEVDDILRSTSPQLGVYELLDYGSDVEVLVRAGNCLLEDLHVNVGRQNRKLIERGPDGIIYKLEVIPEITEEEKEKVRNFAKSTAATILENAGCLG